MRSASIQFGWFTPSEAYEKLRWSSYSDLEGDRIALSRRASKIFAREGTSIVAALLALQESLDKHAKENRRDICYLWDVR